jgi:tetratricopeptide (TPR) repeat protein
MNIKNKFQVIVSAVALFGLTACNDYLDQVPDDRAQVNSVEKVENLLTSAYPDHAPNFLFEMSSDNVTDNGSQYTAQPNQDEMYRFQDVPTRGNDDPYHLWDNMYQCVGTVNEAIAALDELGGEKAHPAEYAEARLCRAYNMYQLANIFCMAYDPTKAKEYLGLPYPTEPEQDVNTHYTRGTLQELYDNINSDIEAALPNVSEGYMKTPKFHFNKSAAYAFAARFNLMMHNYDKAIEYANVVLGANPVTRMRDYTQFQQLSAADLQNAYVKSSENANLLIIAAYSALGRALQGNSYYRRYNHNDPMCSFETFWPEGPWGTGSSNNTLIYATRLFGATDQQIYFPKVREFWEVTDKVNDTGFAHIVFPAFSTEETDLVRAEAYAMKKDYTHAIADMNAWIETHCEKVHINPSSGKVTKRPTLTEESINEFMDGIFYTEVNPASNAQRTIKKTLHPQGFTVETGTQENIIQLILHMRRLETWGEGQRFIDIKRYGIEYAHRIDGESPVIFKAGDLRGAIQIPEDVRKAGLEANPR